jgi:hypothetical protein
MKSLSPEMSIALRNIQTDPAAPFRRRGRDALR